MCPDSILPSFSLFLVGSSPLSFLVSINTPDTQMSKFSCSMLNECMNGRRGVCLGIRGSSRVLSPQSFLLFWPVSRIRPPLELASGVGGGVASSVSTGDRAQGLCPLYGLQVHSWPKPTHPHPPGAFSAPLHTPLPPEDNQFDQAM